MDNTQIKTQTVEVVTFEERDNGLVMYEHLGNFNETATGKKGSIGVVEEGMLVRVGNQLAVFTWDTLLGAAFVAFGLKEDVGGEG